VGSSSLREELFNTYLKARDAPGDVVVSEPTLTETASKQSDAEMDVEQRKKERKERAVREREAQVKANLLVVGADIGRSKMGLDREEGESRFRYASCYFQHLILCSSDRNCPSFLQHPSYRCYPRPTGTIILLTSTDD
jgi:hypothetical protein